MWHKRTGMMVAAMVLSASLAAFADEEPGQRAKTEAAAAEQREREAHESSDRERREDQEAAERERRRDQETSQGERRRGEDNARDDARRQPPESRRGLKRRGDMGPNGMMPAMGMMPGMMGMSGMPGMGPDADRLRETDPEMYELEQLDRRLDRESHELAEHYRRTPQGPARDELRGKLRDVVQRHFKARQERRELEVKRIEAQLDRLRGALERRSKESEAIIDRRMSQMLGEEDAEF